MKKLVKGLESQKQMKIDYAVTFGTEAGQRVLADIEKMSLYHKALSPYDTEGRIDPNLILLQTGSRNLFAAIVHKLGILDKQDNLNDPERK